MENRNDHGQPGKGFNSPAFKAYVAKVLYNTYENHYEMFLNSSKDENKSRTRVPEEAKTLAVLLASIELQELLGMSDHNVLSMLRNSFAEDAPHRLSGSIVNLANIETFYQSMNKAFEQYYIPYLSNLRNKRQQEQEGGALLIDCNNLPDGMSSNDVLQIIAETLEKYDVDGRAREH